MPDSILFLNNAHTSLDDRTFYHQAQSLVRAGNRVTIISSRETLNAVKENVTIDSFDRTNLSKKEEIRELKKRVQQLAPQIIVCDSPVAVLAASSAKNAAIIYDVTEWVPSKKNLRNVRGLKRIVKFFMAVALNFYAGCKTDKFIFGEHYKSVPFRLFFWKKSIEIPYFPDLKYIQYFPAEKIANELKILYSGQLNTDKGFENTANAVCEIARSQPNLTVYLKIIASFAGEKEKSYFAKRTADFPKNISIQLIDFLPFREFCKQIGDAHLYFDLRETDAENTRCLPIKLFYYLACGRPVIYSDLKAIRKKITNFNFGYLVNPQDTKQIASFVNKHISDSDFYLKQCNSARKTAESEYNWQALEKSFVDFCLQNPQSKSITS